jgi:hypothetical protein
MKQKLIMENWRRFINESQLREQQMDQEIEEAMKLQQEGPMLAALAALLSLNLGAGQPDFQGLEMEINGQNIEVPTKALDVVGKVLTKQAKGGGENAELASKALNSLNKALQSPQDGLTSGLNIDDDGDGYYDGGIADIGLGGSSGGVYAEAYIAKVMEMISSSDTGPGPQTIDTSNLDIETGIYTNKGKEYKQVQVDGSDGKLDKGTIAKIAKKAGMSGNYSVQNNTGVGPAIITDSVPSN